MSNNYIIDIEIYNFFINYKYKINIDYKNILIITLIKNILKFYTEYKKIIIISFFQILKKNL